MIFNSDLIKIESEMIKIFYFMASKVMLSIERDTEAGTNASQMVPIIGSNPL